MSKPDHVTVMELLQGEINAASPGSVGALILIQQHIEFMAEKLETYNQEYVKLNKKYTKLKFAIEEGLKSG